MTDLPEDVESAAVVVLRELLDSLPAEHHERPGVLRAVEVLRTDLPARPAAPPLENTLQSREPAGGVPAKVEVGTCDLCGQEMLRTADDCWHPYTVARACPPEPPGASPESTAWANAGNRTGRPGREHFVPLPVPDGAVPAPDDSRRRLTEVVATLDDGEQFEEAFNRAYFRADDVADGEEDATIAADLAAILGLRGPATHPGATPGRDGAREARERVRRYLDKRLATTGGPGESFSDDDVIAWLDRDTPVTYAHLRALLSEGGEGRAEGDSDYAAYAFVNCGEACRTAEHHTQEPGCFYVGADLEPCDPPCATCHPETPRPRGWYDEREERRLARQNPDMVYARCPSTEPHRAHYWSPFAQPTCRCIGLAASEGGEGR